MRRVMGFAFCVGMLLAGWAKAEAQDMNNFYFAPEVGYMLPTNGDVDDGIFVGGRIGYWVDRNWSVELESGWENYGIDVSNNIRSVDADTVPILANLRYTEDFCCPEKMKWYLFGGVGANINDLDDNEAGADLDNSVAWQAGAGLEMPVGDRVAAFLDTRFIWNSADYTGGSGVFADEVDGDVDLHAVMFTGGVKF